MKTRLILFCIATFMALAQSGPVFAGDPAKQFIAVVVVDGSPSRNWSMLLDATKNVYHSLEQSERILVFLVKDRNALLRVSTVKDSSVGGYADFCKLVDTLHHQGWPFGANPVSALKGPIYKHMLQRTKPDDRVMFIIVTEGRFSTRQAEELCDFADQIRDSFNWRLLLTGEVKKTPRKLILAASEGSIGWCKLSDALDPASIKKCIQEPRWFVTIDQEKAAKKIPTIPKPKTGKLDEKPKKAVAKKLSTPPSKPEVQKRGTKKTKPAPKRPGRRPVPLKPKKSRWFSKITVFILAVGVVLVFIIAAFLIVGWIKAESWQKNIQKPLSNASQQDNNPKILMASIGGVSHRLGNIQRFNSVHLGSSAENTIRIDNKSLAPKHLRIYRRGTKLFVRNLAGNPIVINGQQLRKHRQTQITLPATITIAEDVNLRLYLSKVNDLKKKNLEESKNEQK